MEVRFHRRVQADLKEILGKYYDISHQLGEDFFAEFQVGLSKAVENPRRFISTGADFGAVTSTAFRTTSCTTSEENMSGSGFYDTTGGIQIMEWSDFQSKSTERRGCAGRPGTMNTPQNLEKKKAVAR